MEKCGDRNMHWYSDGDTCICGQVPVEIFFAAACTCGQYKMSHPIHKPDCEYALWAGRHNKWIAEHPEVIPPMVKSIPVVGPLPLAK